MSALSSTLFDQWAPSYDHQVNPLLALEERTLPALMPALAGVDVLDIGCGTGRWLRRMETRAPRSLIGVDSSAAMLEFARGKLAGSTRLYRSDACSLDQADSTVDLILGSFVLSYVDDLTAFAKECRRLLRLGGVCLVSDMHPETAAERGWTRSFQDGETNIHVPARHRSLAEIIATFARFDLTVREAVCPAFDKTERPLFEAAGKLTTYADLIGVPAIYLLRLEKVSPSFDLQLTHTRWASNAKTWSDTPLVLQQGLISESHGCHPAIDLTGYVVLPGLINGHDHLEFALFPNLGRDRDEAPYRNATEWAHEIHLRHAETIAQHLEVPLATRLWWGAIRNLLCGVTTVCHHNPTYAEFARMDFPIRVASEFGWSHSLTFGKEVLDEYRQTPPHQPFVLHAAEGTDAASRAEFDELERLGVLDPRTVLIHGVALGPSEIHRLNTGGVSLVVCPSSNDFLFGRAMHREDLRSIDRLALGSDSPLTAAGDLLDEVRYLGLHGVEAADLYTMLTTQAATIFHLGEGSGSILPGRSAPGGNADLIAVRDRGESPADTLARLSFAEIELVLVGGVVQVVSQGLYAHLTEQHRADLELLAIEGHYRYVRAPIAALCRSAEDVLGDGSLRLGGKEIRYVASA